MTPPETLNFSINVLLLVTAVLSIRNLYFRLKWVLAILAYLESLIEISTVWSPVWWVARALTCSTCITYWMSLIFAIVIVWLPPLVGGAWLWVLAVPGVAFLVNYLDPEPRSQSGT
jgi:hypothetical protein